MPDGKASSAFMWFFATNVKDVPNNPAILSQNAEFLIKCTVKIKMPVTCPTFWPIKKPNRTFPIRLFKFTKHGIFPEFRPLSQISGPKAA